MQQQQPPEGEDDYEEGEDGKGFKQNNVLPVWGNEKTMNLNTLILTNIQGSPYFKVTLFELKTYHEVVDEIYYRVSHLEPWEMGSRKTGGQTGMCGGVRGVGAGGIVSSAFCLLYKLFTLKLTRKQLTGMMNHSDSPYIRGLGFMYARYTFPPKDLWDWFVDYLADEEEVDVKAGSGLKMYMGDVCRDFLVKLDWFGALFPRIPVPVQKSIMANLKEYGPSIKEQYHLEKERAEQEQLEKEKEERQKKDEERQKEAEKARAARESQRSSYAGRSDSRRDHRDYGRGRGDRDRVSSLRGRDRDSHRDERPRHDRERRRSRSRERRRSTSRDRKRRSRSRERNGKISGSRDKRSRSRDRDAGSRSRDRDRDTGSRSKDRTHRR